MNEPNKLHRVIHHIKKLFHPENRHYYRITYQVINNLLLLFIISGIVGIAFAVGIGAGYFASLVKAEPIRPKEELTKTIYNYEETSEIYFANNEFLGKLRTDLEREEVPLEQVSDYLKKAVIATEDEYFYQHEGVVPKAVFRALFQEFTNASVQSGGSTLTQQLVKQQILTNEVSFERKAKEILLALRLENVFEKEDILEVYLNVSPFGRNSSGRNIAGVQAAAKGIFGKDVKDLTLAQAAYIAGLPQSPFGYTPFTQDGKLKEKEGLQPGLNRMETVLSRMLQNEVISETEYKQASEYDITKDFIPPEPQAFEQYPWLSTEVEKRTKDILTIQLAAKDGYSEKDIATNEHLQSQYELSADKAMRQNGYKIHITIHKNIYDAMQKTAEQFSHYGKNKTEIKTDAATGKTIEVQEPVELGAVLIENKTGKILSFVGGRDYKREATNHATAATRQNGSTMKPLLVYAPGIELGVLAPGTLTLDAPYSIPAGGKTWQPKNAYSGYTGLTSARKALMKSQNAPAVKFYMDMIDKKPIHYLEKMGFSSLSESDYSAPAVALGGLTNGVTVEENVNAYATLANNGLFIDAYMIEKIETKKGEVIYEHQSTAMNVFSPQTAYLTIDMMRDVLTNGTGTTAKRRLNFRSDFAGKTGTTSDKKDSWFIASNPTITFGVWNGYDTPKTLNNSSTGLTYSQQTQYLWADLINAAYAANRPLIDSGAQFTSPKGISHQSIGSVYGVSTSLLSEAGIRGSDLFPTNYVGKTTKSTTSSGKFVIIGNNRYIASPSTPAEFVVEGTTLSTDFLKVLGGKYLAGGYSFGKTTTGAQQLQDNGKAPRAMTLSLHEKTISWMRHSDYDVIGYRVYRNNQKVATIKVGQALSYTGNPGTYIVKAVDITGKESPASNVITIEADTPPIESTPIQPVETPPTSNPVHETNPELDSSINTGSADSTVHTESTTSP